MPRAAPLALAVLVVALSGCTGIINNNPDLRWWLFSRYGANRICPEMEKRSVPLRLADGAPTIGRFFPGTCSVEINERGRTIVVRVSGTGYGYVVPAKRVGFAINAAVEYRPDFVIAGDDTYLWARVNRIVDGPHFQTGSIENPVMDAMGNLPGFGNLSDFMGKQSVGGALARGFTVIHNEERGDDFTLGIIQPPTRPVHPFQVNTNERMTFANETTDVYATQRDFLGPFEVAKEGQSIFLSTTVQGPPINVVVVTKAVGDAWRDAYQRGAPGAAPPPGPVVYSNVVAPGAVDTRRYNVPPGLYYVVLDNNAHRPTGFGALLDPLNPLTPLGMNAAGLARVSYVAQLAK
jgi:hypothetical protein